MSAEEKKQAAAAALAWLRPDMYIGIGTGSTVNHFIDLLATKRNWILGAVASSEASAQRLVAAGIELIELNQVGDLPLYVDGADEVDPHRRLIKGGGGALTREKIVAEAAQKFVCIVDSSKQVSRLGDFPLPLEVLPMARSLIARKLLTIGGAPCLREDFTSDNGNPILDVRGLDFSDPIALEQEINQWPGVVAVGLFARRGADEVLIGAPAGTQQG